MGGQDRASRRRDERHRPSPRGHRRHGRTPVALPPAHERPARHRGAGATDRGARGTDARGSRRRDRRRLRRRPRQLQTARTHGGGTRTANPRRHARGERARRRLPTREPRGGDDRSRGAHPRIARQLLSLARGMDSIGVPSGRRVAGDARRRPRVDPRTYGRASCSTCSTTASHAPRRRLPARWRDPRTRFGSRYRTSKSTDSRQSNVGQGRADLWTIRADAADTLGALPSRAPESRAGFFSGHPPGDFLGTPRRGR